MDRRTTSKRKLRKLKLRDKRRQMCSTTKYSCLGLCLASGHLVSGDSVPKRVRVNFDGDEQTNRLLVS